MAKRKKRAPTHPGGILKRQYLEPLSVSMSELARVLGVTRKTVGRIVNEHGPVSADMALRLSRAFNTSAELWLNLQRNYDLWHAAEESDDWKKFESIAA